MEPTPSWQWNVYDDGLYAYVFPYLYQPDVVGLALVMGNYFRVLIGVSIGDGHSPYYYNSWYSPYWHGGYWGHAWHHHHDYSHHYGPLIIIRITVMGLRDIILMDTPTTGSSRYRGSGSSRRNYVRHSGVQRKFISSAVWKFQCAGRNFLFEHWQSGAFE